MKSPEDEAIDAYLRVKGHGRPEAEAKLAALHAQLAAEKSLPDLNLAKQDALKLAIEAQAAAATRR